MGKKRNERLNIAECLKLIQKKKPFLKNKFGVNDIAIFGSFARNEMKNTSDIDILVELDKGKKTFDNFMELKFFLSSIIPSHKIDLVIKESIREELKSKILMEAIHV